MGAGTDGFVVATRARRPVETESIIPQAFERGQTVATFAHQPMRLRKRNDQWLVEQEFHGELRLGQPHAMLRLDATAWFSRDSKSFASWKNWLDPRAQRFKRQDLSLGRHPPRFRWHTIGVQQFGQLARAAVQVFEDQPHALATFTGQHPHAAGLQGPFKHCIDVRNGRIAARHVVAAGRVTKCNESGRCAGVDHEISVHLGPP
jgi:hypothetical protein